MVHQQGEAGGQVRAALCNPPSPPSPRPAVSRAARPTAPHHRQGRTPPALSPPLCPIPHCLCDAQSRPRLRQEPPSSSPSVHLRRLTSCKGFTDYHSFILSTLFHITLQSPPRCTKHLHPHRFISGVDANASRGGGESVQRALTSWGFQRPSFLEWACSAGRSVRSETSVPS